ncbi:MAG: cation diffusion facilitator family transporter [Desulfobacterales bacterium]
MDPLIDGLKKSEDTKSSRGKYVRKITWIGLLTNILLAGIKFSAGYFGRSQALVADAIHTLTDTATDIAVIAGSHYWSRPPDECHPYGHRRLETLITVFIGIMLAAAGMGIGWQAISTLHKTPGLPPGWIALIATLISIVTKEIIYRWTAAAGKRIRSPALVANAWHHRSDAISSLPVLIAVGGAMLFPTWSFLDNVGAAVVSIFILHAAMKIIWPGISELIDAGAPGEVRKKILKIAGKCDGVHEIHKVRTRFISTAIQVDMHIVVDRSISVREGHCIADDVKDQIISGIPDVLDVVVHVDPSKAILKK